VHEASAQLERAIFDGAAIFREDTAMIDRKDQKQWGEPELDKAQAENDAIFTEIDGLKGLVANGDVTIEQAQKQFIELLERHRLVGERLRAVARAWGATPGNA
jgi:hypothetical protein